MDINYELYKVFYQVASTLSFSEASKALYISQSAVSQSVKTLEGKLGQKLFIRSTKRVTLTPAGEILFRHIEPAMNLIVRGETRLLDSDAMGFGQLHIGASDTICRYFLVPYLQKFHQQFPQVSIKVTNATSIGCVDLLEQGTVDMIIANFPNAHLDRAYIQKTLTDFSDVFVANPDFFPVPEEALTLEELNQKPLMLLERHSTTSEFLHNLFLDHRLELVPEIELSSNDLLLDLAKIGLGIAIVPDYCVASASSASGSDLVVLKTKEKLPKRRIVAAVNTALPLSEATEAFLALLPES